MTVGSTAACNGMAAPNPTPVTNLVTAIPSIAPDYNTGLASSLEYYPTFSDLHFPTVCDPNAPNDSSCSRVAICDFSNPSTCGVTVLDHYTSSFNWADFNFSALWLRSGWYLLDNSVITDVQNGGLTFVSGGDYLRSSVPLGYWAVASHVAFVGATQPNGKYTASKGPFNNGTSDLSCVFLGNACVNTTLGIPMQLSNFGTYQRLFNIYDGPTYEDSNAFLDINTTPCTSFSSCMYWQTPGVRLGPQGGYMPDAAIGWKQPNGFYYPPAFHSQNMFFNNVDIRHYVIEPFFLTGTYLTDLPTTQKYYTGTVPSTMFTGFTDIDRQTELNDDDGSLTGLAGTFAPLNQTISVNKDNYFSAPVETDQCRSNFGVDPTDACTGVTTTRATATTSPYDYVTTVMFPNCGVPGAPEGACGSATTTTSTQQSDPPNVWTRFTSLADQGGIWSKSCSGPYCFGLPIYRQFLVGNNTAGSETGEWLTWKNHNCNADPSTMRCQFPFARMAGTANYQRSILTVNGGTYYIDTNVSQTQQRNSRALGIDSDKASTYVECENKPIGNCQPRSVNVFQGGQTYYVFFVYAKGSTQQTYQVYVGDGFDPQTDINMIRMTIQPAYTVVPETTWPTAWTRQLIAGPDGKKNVLQVTVNMSPFKAELNPTVPLNGTCKPQSFCTPSGSSCVCNLKPTDPRVIADPKLISTCTSTCGTWAVKDLDCPTAGCLGFSIKLPPVFKADNSYHRPTPTPFPTTGSLWTAKLVRTTLPPDSTTPNTAYKASSCYYPQIPGTDCPVPSVP
jgi:hypothetical protein